MKLQPVKTHILAKFYNPPKQKIVTQSKVLSGEHRTIIEVIAVGPEVATCKVGDFLWLKPGSTPIGVDEKESLGVFDDTHVLGVTDDTRPLEVTV